MALGKTIALITVSFVIASLQLLIAKCGAADSIFRIHLTLHTKMACVVAGWVNNEISDYDCLRERPHMVAIRVTVFHSS